MNFKGETDQGFTSQMQDGKHSAQVPDLDVESQRSEPDPLRWCKAGQHVWRNYRADGSEKICAVCKEIKKV